MKNLDGMVSLYAEYTDTKEINMPKCVTCGKIFPPQFVITLAEDAFKCIFCEKQISEIEIENGKDLDGKPLSNNMYKKDQVVKDYDIFLKKLKGNKNIAKLLTKGDILDANGRPIKQ